MYGLRGVFIRLLENGGQLSDPYVIQKVFPYIKLIVGTWWSTHVIFHLAKEPLVLVKKDPKRLHG